MRKVTGLVLLIGIGLGAVGAEAAALSRAIGRGVAKAAASPLRRAPVQLLRRDLVRDRATRIRPLPQDRTVFRYTTKERAREEIRRGIPPGSHMASRGGPGRPLSQQHAQRRYGLPDKPEVRETIRLPKGHPVRLNRAYGGEQGAGEITSPLRVPREAVQNVTPLRPGKE
jgi:hypothetical protein